MAEEEADFNERNIAEFRTSGGRIGSVGDAPVLLLHTVGARSGRQRVSPMMYRPDPTDTRVVHVFASAAGRAANPGWYHNLRAHPRVDVEIGAETVSATASVLGEPERSRVYHAQAADYPAFADYQAKTARQIPVVTLTLDRDR